MGVQMGGWMGGGSVSEWKNVCRNKIQKNCTLTQATSFPLQGPLYNSQGYLVLFILAFCSNHVINDIPTKRKAAVYSTQRGWVVQDGR